MNGKTLQRTQDLDQIEWMYADTFTGTSSSVATVQQNLGGAGRFVEVMQGRAIVTANIFLATDNGAGAGKRKIAYPVTAGSFSDPNTFRRSSAAGISTVSVTSTVNTLQYLAIKGRKKYLTSVDLQSQSLLKRFDISNSPALTSLTLFSCARLESVSTAGCKNLTSLNVTVMDSLKSIVIDEESRPKLTLLYLTNLNLIEDFNFRGMTSLGSFNVTSMTSLRSMDLIDTQVSGVNSQSMSALRYLRLPATLNFVYVPSAPLLNTADLSACASVRYVDLSGCASLSSLSMPTGWTGGNSKAKLFISNCNFSAAALVSILNNLGTFSGYKNYVDVSGNPGSTDGAVESAASNAADRGWYVYTGVVQ